jgi:hypothetical protein
MHPRKVALLTLYIFALAIGAPSHLFHVHAQEKVPVSFICTMHQDVVDDKPGICPQCKMVLQPVRIESAFSCTTHGSVIRDVPGRCPLDKRELVPVFINHFWDCGEIPEHLYADAGKCANGKPREERKIVRAHGDHNPRHGGQFFMGTDKWHHVEGVYPTQNLLKVYVYDNFTQPLDLKSITGRAFTKEDGNKELDPVRLTASRDGKTLEAKVPGAAPAKGSPQRVSIRLRFKPETPEDKFDFTFDDFSKEPVSTPTTTTAAAKPAAVPGKPTVAPAAKPSAPSPAPATTAAAPRGVTPVSPAAPPAGPPGGNTAQTSAPASQSPIGALPDVGAPALTMTRTDAATLSQDLPNNTAELLKLLDLRAQEVQQLIQEGNFGMVYVPTMLAKEVALALEGHVSELPVRQHPPLTSAVRQLVLAAWRLDQYGDLGDREKITNAHSVFAAAAAEIKAVYASR